MKKILILAPHIGKVNRGAETFVIELTKALKDKYEIVVFSQGINEDIKDNIVQVQLRQNFIFNLYVKLYNQNQLFRKFVDRIYYAIPEVIFQKKFSKVVYKKYLKTEKFDLLFPNNGIWGGHYANKIRKSRNIPYIYTGHGGIGKGEEIILKTNPNRYVCLSQEHQKWAKQFSKRTTIIHNGVDVSSFSNRKQEEKNKKVVLIVGALTSFKRHSLTIDAVAKMDDNIELLILGSGELENQLKNYANQKLGKRCTIKNVSYRDMKNYYATADVFTLPSLMEPFGIVYLEAMSSNLPIVAPDDSVRHEIIGDAGLFCDVENPDEYSKCLEAALSMEWKDTPLRRAKQFDWKTIALNYSRLFDDVISEPSKISMLEE